MNIDPAASMRSWACDVELGGHAYLLAARPAADWWPVLTEGDLTDLLADLTARPEDRHDPPPDPEDLLMDGAVTLAEVNDALIEAVESAAGRPLHAAITLAAVARQHWPEINGQLAYRGFRWDQQPLGAALDAIYLIVVRALPEERDEGGRKSRPRDEFLALLENDSILTGEKPKASPRALSDFEAVAGPKPTAVVRATAAPSGRARSRIRRPPQQPRPDGP